jgi:hypothetical protein
MKLGKYVVAAALLVASAFAVGAHAQVAAPAKAKVVFQVSDGDAAKWGLALNNVNNVLQEMGSDKVEIEVVAYGPGIGMLKADSTAANRVMEAVQSGVKIVACENTMKAQKLSKADMNMAIGFVPAGVVEIIKRQGEGWAYIRP